MKANLSCPYACKTHLKPHGTCASFICSTRFHINSFLSWVRPTTAWGSVYFFLLLWEWVKRDGRNWGTSSRYVQIDFSNLAIYSITGEIFLILLIMEIRNGIPRARKGAVCYLYGSRNVPQDNHYSNVTFLGNKRRVHGETARIRGACIILFVLCLARSITHQHGSQFLNRDFHSSSIFVLIPLPFRTSSSITQFLF